MPESCTGKHDVAHTIIAQLSVGAAAQDKLGWRTEQTVRFAITRLIFSALENNYTLTDLKLAVNEIWDDGAEKIAAALEKNKSLTALTLAHTDISWVGAERLAAALASNHTLTALALSRSAMEPPCDERIASALARNRRAGPGQAAEGAA